MWFASGIIMMYVPFPSLPDQGRLAYLDRINTDQIRISPSEALSKCPAKSLTGLRLITINQRPAYVCHRGPSPVIAVFADDGSLPYPLSILDTTLHKLIAYVQWVVHQRFDPYRPFYRVNLNDDAGTHIYISTRTGEVIQRTERNQRMWNYVGAVIHWIYPTFLRKHWAVWDQTVWWLSLAGMVSVLIGIYLGLSAFLKFRRTGNTGFSPFNGWMRWHHVFGLVTGFVVLTWIFSGWLSMDHGRLFSLPDPTDDQRLAFRDMTISDIANNITISELGEMADVKEISFHAVAGQSFLFARDGINVQTSSMLTQEDIREAISNAWPDKNIIAVARVADKDTYTSLREGSIEKGTYRIMLNDENRTWIHINQHNGEILSVMDRSRRLYRWLFNGLHSLDFPGFVNQRPLWDIVMIFLLLSGFIFCITGIILSFNHLRRKFTI
jgi:hypothetical protein